MAGEGDYSMRVRSSARKTAEPQPVYVHVPATADDQGPRYMQTQVVVQNPDMLKLAMRDMSCRSLDAAGRNPSRRFSAPSNRGEAAETRRSSGCVKQPPRSTQAARVPSGHVTAQAQLAAVLAGHLPLADACPAVQSWARLPIHRHAVRILGLRTIAERRAALEELPETIRGAVEARVLCLWANHKKKV
jgi:hypothetical protein